MKILISHDSGAHLYDRIGFQRVLVYCGHDCRIWNIKEKSSHDAFYEFPPDLLITQLHNIDRALYSCILKMQTNPNVNFKWIAKAGHWGPIDSEIDVKRYPVLVASDEHKRIVEELHPSFVFVHYHPNRIERTMGSWRNLTEPVGIPNGADVFEYLGGEVRPEFECDCSIISGYWPYKAQNLNRYIVPLCHPVGKFKIRIYGNSHWPVGQYMGLVDENNAKHVFKSTKVNLDCHEPHGPDFGFDVTERIFKVACAGGFYLSGGYVESTDKDFFPNMVCHAKDPEDFEDEIRGFLENEDVRNTNSKELQKKVLESHTYFDRVAYMFEKLSLPLEAENVLKKKGEFLGSAKVI